MNRRQVPACSLAENGTGTFVYSQPWCGCAGRLPHPV